MHRCLRDGYMADDGATLMERLNETAYRYSASIFVSSDDVSHWR